MSKEIERGTNVETTTDAEGHTTTVESKYERVVEIVAKKAAYVPESVQTRRTLIAAAREMRKLSITDGGEMGMMAREARKAIEDAINAEDRMLISRRV